MGHLARGQQVDLGALPGVGWTQVLVPRPGQGRQGQRRRLGRGDCRVPGEQPADRRLRVRAHRRPVRADVALDRAERLGALSTGNLVAITGGPVVAGGYTWHRIRGALRDWPASATTHTDVWVATSSATETFVAPAPGPHQTRVAGQIRGLTFGNTGTSSIGASTTARKHRSFSPNGDGRYDILKVRWTNGVDLDAIELRIFRTDGTAVGTVPFNRCAVGRPRPSLGWQGRRHAGPERQATT